MKFENSIVFYWNVTILIFCTKYILFFSLWTKIWCSLYGSKFWISQHKSRFEPKLKSFGIFLLLCTDFIHLKSFMQNYCRWRGCRFSFHKSINLAIGIWNVFMYLAVQHICFPSFLPIILTNMPIHVSTCINLPSGSTKLNKKAYLVASLGAS